MAASPPTEHRTSRTNALTMDHRSATAARAATTLSRGSISILAAACGLAVANANYSQPLLVDIGQSLHLTDSAVSLLPALTQLGVSAGILCAAPGTIPTLEDAPTAFGGNKHSSLGPWGNVSGAYWDDAPRNGSSCRLFRHHALRPAALRDTANPD
jgi:hypothetical protein